MFSSKKRLDSEAYEKLANRITDLENGFDKLSSKFMSLRGLIHRKFTGDIVPAETEEIKKTDGLESLRGL